MKISLARLALCAAALQATAVAAAGSHAGATASGQQITRLGTQPSAAGPADYFTGRARVDPGGPESGARHRPNGQRCQRSPRVQLYAYAGLKL